MDKIMKIETIEKYVSFLTIEAHYKYDSISDIVKIQFCYFLMNKLECIQN